MKTFILHIAFLCSGAYGFAQVELTEPVNLSGSLPTKKQVGNLALPESLSSAVNANAYLTNYLLMGTPLNSGDSLDLSFEVGFSKYYTGMSLYFVFPLTNAGPVYIKTGSLPYKEVKVYNRSLDSGEVIQNRLINVIYNGSVFEMMTEPYKPCPNGFVAVNENYCIEALEHDTITFFNAVVDCMSKNSRLCSWSEWYYACNNAGSLGLALMTGNYEWLDDSGNYTGNLGAKTTGLVDCKDTYSEYPLLKRAYRCCYSR